MKKYLLFLLLTLTVIACSKDKVDPVVVDPVDPEPTTSYIYLLSEVVKNGHIFRSYEYNDNHNLTTLIGYRELREKKVLFVDSIRYNDEVTRITWHDADNNIERVYNYCRKNSNQVERERFDKNNVFVNKSYFKFNKGSDCGYSAIATYAPNSPSVNYQYITVDDNCSFEIYKDGHIISRSILDGMNNAYESTRVKQLKEIHTDLRGNETEKIYFDEEGNEKDNSFSATYIYNDAGYPTVKTQIDRKGDKDIFEYKYIKIESPK